MFSRTSYSKGLHQKAIEAKEGVKVQRERLTYAILLSRIISVCIPN